MNRFLPVLLCCLYGLWCVQAQIEVPDLLDEEDPAPKIEEEETPLDEEAVRALTHQIQSRTQRVEIAEAVVDHPGKTHYASVYQRLLQKPEQVRVRIELLNGVRKNGFLENQLLEVHTLAGTLPIPWSDIRRIIDPGTENLQILLQGVDEVDGTLSNIQLILERDDAGTEFLFLGECRQIDVLL